jgi:hypothetical protein
MGDQVSVVISMMCVFKCFIDLFPQGPIWLAPAGTLFRKMTLMPTLAAEIKPLTDLVESIFLVLERKN